MPLWQIRATTEKGKGDVMSPWLKKLAYVLVFLMGLAATLGIISLGVGSCFHAVRCKDWVNHEARK
jgi:hypothetical protein